MFSVLHRISARIGIWPRRIGCVVCLLLAATSALGNHTTQLAGAASAAGPLGGLRPGEVAVPVTVADSGGYLHAGDRIGLLAARADPVTGSSSGSASLLADGVRVLSVSPTGGIGGNDTTVLLVAVQRAQAAHIAAAEGAGDGAELTPILEAPP